jgi:hypothetical protein
MYKRVLTAALVFGMLAAAPPVAHAQSSCGDRTAMVEQLSRIYGEERKGAGIVGQTALFEIWASDVTGSWTILKTYPNGTACLVAAGGNWHDNAPAFTPAGLGDQAM